MLAWRSRRRTLSPDRPVGTQHSDSEGRRHSPEINRPVRVDSKRIDTTCFERICNRLYECPLHRCSQCQIRLDGVGQSVRVSRRLLAQKEAQKSVLESPANRRQRLRRSASDHRETASMWGRIIDQAGCVGIVILRCNRLRYRRPPFFSIWYPHIERDFHRIMSRDL
jgi:hypothetical protein